MPTKQQPVRKGRSRHRLWPSGVHIAPYLSPAGRFVLVAIGRPNYFVIASEVMSLRGARSNGDPRGSCYTSWMLEPCEPQDGLIPFLNPKNAGLRGRALETLLWSRGVHLAPWQGGYECGDTLGVGRPMIAVDAGHRLVAEMMVPNGGDAEAVRRDLLAILESVEASSETDDAQPAESWPDDDDEGETWRRSARE